MGRVGMMDWIGLDWMEGDLLLVSIESNAAGFGVMPASPSPAPIGAHVDTDEGVGRGFGIWGWGWGGEEEGRVKKE